MKILPYLNFYGQGEEALEFYKGALDAEIISSSRYSDEKKMKVAEKFDNWIMFSSLKVKDELIYIVDTVNADEAKQGNNMYIMLECDSEEQIRNYFKKLSEGATITIPLEDTFWGSLYGSLKDKFGVNWNFNYHK